MPRTDHRCSPADTITLAIIAKLEEGVRPWIRPWRSDRSNGRPRRANGEPYRGINSLWLGHLADALGYGSDIWMTYRQAQELGGQVRKGERSQIVFFYKSYPQAKPNAADDEIETRRVLRTYAVFSVDQIDGLPQRFAPVSSNAATPFDILPEAATLFIDGFPGAIRHGDRAFYHRGQDFIALPSIDLFQSRAHWAATLMHEAGHWTGHPSRLDRAFGRRFGDEAYAVEELCAELCASFLGADLGLPPQHLDDHASYIDHWLKVLRMDSRALFNIAAKAEAAASYLHSLIKARPRTVFSMPPSCRGAVAGRRD
ncbi:antirestriction protein ArdC [Rhizorhabdus wittichii DC-6]|nr:antirestriction protein ArdC [Rhizorhabdus wittichii DC-6]